jgi:hypothetical protein
MRRNRRVPVRCVTVQADELGSRRSRPSASVSVKLFQLAVPCQFGPGVAISGNGHEDAVSLSLLLTRYFIVLKTGAATGSIQLGNVNSEEESCDNVELGKPDHSFVIASLMWRSGSSRFFALLSPVVKPTSISRPGRN